MLFDWGVDSFDHDLLRSGAGSTERWYRMRDGLYRTCYLLTGNPALAERFETLADEIAVTTGSGNPPFSGEGCRLQRVVAALPTRCLGVATT